MSWDIETIENHGEGIYRITNQWDPVFPPGALWDALNMVYADESDNPEVMRGTTRLGVTDMGGAVTGMFDHDSGTKLIASCADGKIYQYTGTDWAAESGAAASGNDTTATTRWNAEGFYGATSTADLTVLCNGIDAPAKYDNTDVTALGGSPPSTGNFPTEFMGRLALAQGDLVTFSAPNDCEQWTVAAGAKRIQVARGKDGPIVGMRNHGGVLLVFKRNSTYRIRPTQTFTSADVAQVSANIGLVSARTLADAGSEGAENLSWASSQGLEMIQATDTSVGWAVRNITRWPKNVMSFRNKAQMDVAWSDFNIDRRELYFHYPTGSNTIPKEGIIGNFARPRKLPRWTRMDKANLTAGVVYRSSGTEFVQYAGDSNGRVYLMHVDTASDWAGSPFTGRIITPYHVQKRAYRMKEYNWSFVDVQTEGNYDVRVNQAIMRRGLPAAAGDNVTALSVLGAESGWGEGEWAEAVWGGTTYAGERIRPPTVSRGAGLAHLIYSTRWFRLNTEAIEYMLKSDSLAA